MHRVGSNHYSNVINETVSINTEVLYINATDKDSGDFGTVRYYLLTPTGIAVVYVIICYYMLL